ncbi:dGTPase [Brevibacillus ruminantium]|uniref:Deoxyguanosinetriphosphate triphosphohydrolase-like protein n=1 Tax=Brevibacillus ruminantium TaxID=2950604 RepID=A0ABY4WI99_9BACL|nr:anti-phage deoxyguanosine triphosphatase [Brevibacillus ruminantium]USG66526.1 dGTPase [Brevibacillus ruminantium]
MYLLIGSDNHLYLKEDIERMDPSRNDKRNPLDARDDFERDHGRIVHTSAFRRLQAKTQVIGPEEGDFHRTRLTHSMEVAQIARGIAIHLNKNSKVLREAGKIDISLLESAALAHDFGHPPFGHQGERALNEMMLEYGGFEGNAHTFRLLTKLEGDKEFGLNLTRATLLATLKYPVIYEELVNPGVYSGNNHFKPPKASVFEEDRDAFEWLLSGFSDNDRVIYTDIDKTIVDEKGKPIHKKSKNKTLECSIIEIADDIAYATHDLEDSLKLRLIKINELKNLLQVQLGTDSKLLELIKEIPNDVSESNFSFKLKELFAYLISMLITNVEILEDNQFASPRLRFKAILSARLKDLTDVLNDNLVYEEVILSQRVQTIEWKGGQIVRKLFTAMMNEKNLLPKNDREKWSSKTPRQQARLVCDYIAGMTDSFAAKMYSRLYEAKAGRLFDI